MYDRDEIDRVRAAASIVELASAVTTVKRQGRTYKAICPFHQEKTPSLSLDPTRNLYYCFGCQASGDAFTFVQETQGLDFHGAVESLAARAGITLTHDPEAGKRAEKRSRLVEATRQAVTFYSRRLKEGPDAGPARKYLRSRGYATEVVDTFKMGYAPGGDHWDALVSELKAGGIGDRDLLDADLARRGTGGRLRDRFRDRVLFPIFDLRGDPVGFGARTLSGEGAKYLNTAETPIYHKAKLLYGLDRAKQEISRAGYALIVEGYTDVIGMHDAGLPIAVATCGTALGDAHFDLLRRFTDRVVLAFDADEAGAGAALRGGELTTPFELGIDLRVAKLPTGVDPADMASQGRIDELRTAVDSSVPLTQFRLERVLAGFRLDEPEGRARAVKESAGIVKQISDPIARAEYVRYVSKETGVPVDEVSLAFGSRPQSGAATTRAVQQREEGAALVESELLRALLSNPDGFDKEWIDPELFLTHRGEFELLEPEWRDTEPGSPVPIPNDGQSAEALRRMAMDDRPVANAQELVLRLKGLRLDERIAELRTTLESTDADGDPQGYSSSFEELIALEQEKRRLGTT